tara:strand:- start:144 stop:323 length:180 start_codon:yes stop_codon:yes gene_type:complete
MKTFIKTCLGCLLLYCVLAWAVENPKSAKKAQRNIDETVSSATEEAKDFAKSLQDNKGK